MIPRARPTCNRFPAARQTGGDGMLALFQSNWKVRDEWFRWCMDIPQVELDALRTGGLRSIQRTLFHIVDMEQYWIRCLVYGTEHRFAYAEYAGLDELIGL